MIGAEISAIEPAAWDEARRRHRVIRRLAKNALRTRADVAAGAAEIGCGPTQAYVLLRRYLLDPRLTSLLPRTRGPSKGVSRLSDEVAELIRYAIDTVYLTRQKPKIEDLITEVRRRCVEQGLKAPHRKSVTARLRRRPAREIIAKREGAQAARNQFAPAVGFLEAPWPLSLVQIDHTPVDVIVVDSVTRAPIQRPWLTLAIDVCTRCVTGFHLSLEPPSATSAQSAKHSASPQNMAQIRETKRTDSW